VERGESYRDPVRTSLTNRADLAVARGVHEPGRLAAEAAPQAGRGGFGEAVPTLGNTQEEAP
jgi:hypothetical protein